jgi:hypothetical protein
MIVPAACGDMLTASMLLVCAQADALAAATRNVAQATHA